MKAKRGYKWQLTEDYTYTLSERWKDILPYWTEWYVLDARSLTLKKGYAWDGATGIPDLLSVVRASAVHDALYQAMRLGHLDHNRYRDAADLEFKDICRQAGTARSLALILYLGVRAFANFAIDPARESKHKEVP